MFLKLNDILDKNDYKVTDAEVKQAFQNLGYITNTLSLKEFEEAIIANEITNFRPYVEEGTFHENRDRKALCIQYGVAQELYQEWAQSDDPDRYDDWIQLFLAEKSYCLDILCKSDNKEILTEVLKHDLNYAIDDDNIIMTDHRYLVYNELMATINPPLTVLKQYFKTKDDNDDNYDDEALKLKLKAMTRVPTTIEKTMSPVQLYISKNPLWALSLNGYHIKQVLNAAADIALLEKILERN